MNGAMWYVMAEPCVVGGIEHFKIVDGLMTAISVGRLWIGDTVAVDIIMMIVKSGLHMRYGNAPVSVFAAHMGMRPVARTRRPAPPLLRYARWAQ